MVSGGGAVGGEIFVNIRSEGGTGGGVPGAGGTPGPAGGGRPPKDPQMSMLNADQKKQLEQSREEKKALKEYQDFQKLKNKESQNDLLNELQRGRRQATMVAGAVTTGMLARNSKIMASATGALTQLFGAFIDVFLMPFIPLIIPVLKYIASLLPKWMEWTQKFADLFAKDPMAALRMAGKDFLNLIGDAGVQIGKLFGFSEEEVRNFYTLVGELASTAWTGISTAWTTSLDYLKGVWEESGGSIWGSIKIMAEDAWGAALTGAETAWCAFAAWQPGVASTITGAWRGAAGYVKGVWEEGGCTVMGSIGVVGTTAMRGIGAAGRWAWKQFEAWQPGVAASIEGAWCSASTHVQGAWERGGGTIPGFFAVIATEAGQKIKEGLSWLWNEGGFKAKLLGILDKIQEWIFAKTGIGGGSKSRTQEGSMLTPEGGLWDLNTITAGNIGNYAQNTYQGSATAPNWQTRLGMHDMGGWKNRGMDFLRAAGQKPLAKFGIGPKWDAFDRDKNLAQDLYQQHATGSFEWHAQQMEDQGYGVRDIQQHIDRRYRESYAERFSHVSMVKKNGEWEATVVIHNEFLPDDKIDGMVIS